MYSHGDTLVTVNPAGVVTGGPFVYGPYGEQIGGSHADQTSSSADYGWVGQHRKATETLLQNVVQMGAPPYHPGLGRFLAVDPVEGGTPNDYVYVTDPVNSFDLNGMWGLPNPIGALKDKVVETVSSAAASVGSAVVSGAKWAHRNRSGIAAVLGTAALIVGTGGVVGVSLLVAATAVSAYDAYHACKGGVTTGCALAATSTVLGAVGGAVAIRGAQIAARGTTALAAARTARAASRARWGAVAFFRHTGAMAGGRALQVAGRVVYGAGVAVGGVGWAVGSTGYGVGRFQ